MPDNDEGAPRGAFGHNDPAAGRSARGRVLRRSDGRRVGAVVELLLGTEERVEHLVAQALGHGDGDDATDDRDEQELAEAALALRLGGVVPLGASRRAEDASRSASADRLRSACSFLSSMRFFAGALPLFRRVYALRAASKATTMLSRSSSSWMTRCRYGFSFAAWAAAAAFAALSFAAI